MFIFVLTPDSVGTVRAPCADFTLCISHALLEGLVAALFVYEDSKSVISTLFSRDDSGLFFCFHSLTTLKADVC